MMFPEESNRSLRTDAADAAVEVRPDQDRRVDEFFPRQTEDSEILIEIQEFWRHGARSAAGREEFGRCDREEPHEPRRAEQERIVVFRAGRPGLPFAREVRSLGLSFAGRLDPGDSDERQERLRLVHHRAREARGPAGLRPRRRRIAGRDRRAVLALRLLAGLDALLDLLPLQVRRTSVENEHRTNVVVGEEARRSEGQSVQVRRDASLRVLQRLTISRSHDRQELVQFEIPVHRDRAPAQRVEARWMAYGNRCEEDAHDTLLIAPWVMAFSTTRSGKPLNGPSSKRSMDRGPPRSPRAAPTPRPSEG